jgi:hypothetical protein
MIHWFADRLRRFADRIDRAGAPKAIGWRMRFVLHQGVVFDDKGPGAQLWVLNDEGYNEAFNGKEYWTQ